MISEKKISEVGSLIDEDLDVEQIAEELQIALSTARRYIRYVKVQKGEGRISARIPRVLVFDIETAMMKVHVWGQYKQRIPDQNVIEDWFMLGWGAKWLFESDTMSAILTPKEAVAREDKRILIGLWQLLNEADVVIAHNGDKFDIRKANARFIEKGFFPPMPFQSIDTLKVCKKNFAFSSYKLNTVVQKFGIAEKLHTGFDLWKRCLKGDQEALTKMSEYNIQDVLILEELYVVLRPWIRSHPNMGVYMDIDGEVCTNCGSVNLEYNGDYYTTTVNQYKACRCVDCKSPGRSRKGRKISKDLIVPTAR